MICEDCTKLKIEVGLLQEKLDFTIKIILQYREREKIIKENVELTFLDDQVCACCYKEN